MNLGVVIAAGGVGKRMGKGLPKQFLKIRNKAIICHVFDRFVRAGVSRLVVSIHPDWKDDVLGLMGDYPNEWNVVVGGERRQDSVMNGIDALGDVENVLVHDAARPFIRPSLIKKCEETLKTEEAVLVALLARDTIKEGKDKKVARTIDRNKIWLAQTPQGGRTKILREALQNSGDVTDDAMAFESVGIKPALIEGDPWNIKITTEEDLVIANAIAERITKDENWHGI